MKENHKEFSHSYSTQQLIDKGQTNLPSLQYPSLLPGIIEAMDSTKSACYNFKNFVGKRYNSVKDF